MSFLSTIDPNVLATILLAVATLAQAVATIVGSSLSRHRGGGGHAQTATGNSAPVNQQMIDQSRHVTVQAAAATHESRATTATKNRPAAIDTESDPWAPFVLAGLATLAAMWALTTWWDQIAVIILSLVTISLVSTAATWFTWRSLGVSARWLSGIIVIASAAVVWSVFVVPAGFAGIPGLAELAAAIAAGTGDTMTNFLDVLSIEIVFAYTMRILGLATLLYLLTVTTAEAWGMAILGREADRDVPREGMMRFGARLAAIFPVTLSRMLAFTVMLAIAIALIHPASLGWFLSLMPSH